MTRDHAHEILNRVRAGHKVSKAKTMRALTVTGDLPVYADTKTAFDAYSRDFSDEHDSWPVVRRHLPVGAWEVSTAKYRRAASPFDGLTA